MKIERIGCISEGSDGTETYVRFELEQKDKEEFSDPEDWPDLIKGYMMNAYWCNSNSTGPGQSFCTDIRVAAVPYADDRFIGVATMRYDI